VADSATISGPDHTVSKASASASKMTYITTNQFASLDISNESKRAIAETLGYTNMTPVQAQSLPVILRGDDCLAKAKTGTGKTLAFLIPTVEVIRKKAFRKDRNAIPVLILSPTRELAAQIAAEAEELLSFQQHIKVVCVVGGTNANSDKKNLMQDVSVLVATPGRLTDHLQHLPGFQQRFQDMHFLIMDEADQLLEMGFRPSIEQILSMLPDKSSRQTLLFSATVSQSIQQIAATSLRPGYSFVDTVGEETEQTHIHVKQSLVVVPLDDIMPAMAAILHEQMKVPNYKIIIFFPTARVTGFMAEIFGTFCHEVLEIHSRMSQSRRTRTSEDFRDGSNMLLFSSDVSARGMDYPDVTFVLQVGMTEREQYIHRLGRTARAGKEGSGLLLLTPFEESVMRRDLSDIPFITLPAQNLSIESFKPKVQTAVAKVEIDPELKTSAEQAYAAWLGFYKGFVRKFNWTPSQLVETANHFSKLLGLREPPALQKSTIGKMGLRGVPGLRIAAFEERSGGGRGGGGYGGDRDRGGDRGGGASRSYGRGGSRPAPY